MPTPTLAPKQLLIVALLAIAACKEPATPPAPTATEKPSAAPVAAAGARVETAEYTVSLAARSSEGTITIAAKPPLHINPDYPTAFRPDPGPVTFDAPKVPLGQESKKPCAAKPEDTCESTSTFKYSGATPGARVAGTILFSVCEAERCLIEKAPVVAAVGP